LIKVPETIEAQCLDQSIRCPEACLIRYDATLSVISTPVLVTSPTFVLICSGTKQLKPQNSESLLTIPTGSVLAMRSGTHVMSEFQGEDNGYSSLILSVKRDFLQEVVGKSTVCNDGVRVVVYSPSSHTQQLFSELPKALSQPLPERERKFKLRELLITLMSDQRLRELVHREVADWGNTEEERLLNVMATHCLSPLQISEYAKLCSMSLSSFKRRFQRIYGMAPGVWLAKSRLEHAHSMIRNSHLSIRNICHQSGYLDVSSFIRAFRRHFDVTPGSLRQRA
jgi:AraC-like DNA-binding protein